MVGNRNSGALYSIFSHDYAREPVPLSKRVHWLYLFFIWVAVGVDLAAFYLGAVFSQGNEMWSVIWAILIGSAILTPIAALSGWIGADKQLLLVRSALGSAILLPALSRLFCIFCPVQIMW